MPWNNNQFKLKKCARCGKEFIPNKNVQKYCKECTHIAYTEGMRQYHKEHSSKEGYNLRFASDAGKNLNLQVLHRSIAKNVDLL